MKYLTPIDYQHDEESFLALADCLEGEHDISLVSTIDHANLQAQCKELDEKLKRIMTNEQRGVNTGADKESITAQFKTQLRLMEVNKIKAGGALKNYMGMLRHLADNLEGKVVGKELVKSAVTDLIAVLKR